MNDYRDEPILFGPEQRLLGVVTRPLGNSLAGVACLMFNFGVTHRAGPRRIQVKLARRLARQGVASLRFDLSGLGDSLSAQTALGFEEQALEDLRLAVDQIEQQLGIRQVIVIGLCSGAIQGLQAALQDPRINGLLAFDGHRFTSRSARLMVRIRRFMRFPVAQTRHWIDRLRGTDRPPEGDLLGNGVQTQPMTPELFRQAMDTLVARGVAVYLVFSGTVQSRDRDKDQLHGLRGSAFLEQVRYEFMPNLDHSFTELAGQAFFLDAVCLWLKAIQDKRAEPAAAATADAAAQTMTIEMVMRPEALAAG